MSRNAIRHRAPKRPKEQLRSSILAAGHGLLEERGLEGGATSVPLTAALDRAAETIGERITAASVYGRIWATQTQFHEDLLLEAARAYPAGEEAPTLAQARRVIASADRSTVAGRKAALDEVWRTAGAVHLEVLEASRNWQIWVGIWALTVSSPGTDDDAVLGPALRDGDAAATAALAEVLRVVTEALGYRARDPYSIDDFAIAVSCLAEGFALRERFSALDDAAADGAWSPYCVALRALADAYLEPIVRWKPSAEHAT